MAKRSVDDNIMMGPLPNARLPWLVILLLLVCLWLVYWGFLTPPKKLLGPKIPANTYQQYLTPSRPRPSTVPSAVPASPASTSTVPVPTAPAHPTLAGGGH